MISMVVAPLALAAPEGQQGSPFSFLAMMALIFGIFYFLLIAPARKKQKQHAAMIGALKNGDRVVTTGGLYGTVVGVSETVIQLRIADKVKIEVARNAIADLVSADGAR